jgi:hypothetical protein
MTTLLAEKISGVVLSHYLCGDFTTALETEHAYFLFKELFDLGDAPLSEWNSIGNSSLLKSHCF